MRAPSTYASILRSVALAATLVASACAGDADEPAAPFTLRFAAVAGGQTIGCGDRLAGLGPDGRQSMSISDLRFYVSNLRFLDADQRPVPLTLDDDEFQHDAPSGQVALVDLTSNTEGACADAAISFAEGTARTNDTITGTTDLTRVAAVRFDVGVPQALMKETIATTTAEAAPSPLNEMYWSWATGYRHFVLNFSVEDGAGELGEGYLHVGSRDCGAQGELALEQREACRFVNTPRVALDNFDLEADTVALDLSRLVQGLEFVAPVYDPETFEVIGQGPGAQCHSAPGQPDCEQIFDRLGLEMSTGEGIAAANQVFAVLP